MRLSPYSFVIVVELHIFLLGEDLGCSSLLLGLMCFWAYKYSAESA